ncbi:MAG TPA: arginine--tRNA ligase, partial [Nitrososphaera sp.]|nr:arginine--tRNA ligase [Nitrososphaera sp.]
EALAEELRSHEALAKVDVAGPGFLNLRLTDSAVVQTLGQELAKSLTGQKFVTEYSDPNPFKPLHAGHLYTTLVGDMIARLVQHAGAETIRLNFGGDVGLHVGKSMWAIVRSLGGELPDKLAEIPEAERPPWLGARYVDGNNAYEADEQAKQEIIETNKRVYQLHEQNDHDSPFAQIYWTCRQWSYDYFKVLYDQLQVVPFDRFVPESEVTPLGVQTVNERLNAGVYERSDGAVIFDGEKYGLHKRVFINSEGLPTYEAKDVGLSLTKWQDYKFDESIIITAAEQQQYMEVVIKSIEQFAPEPARRTKHLTHGVVKLQGGVKISSRKGNGPTALDILQAAREAGEATGTNPSEETILAAVKYAFAKNRVGSDIVYDPKESIALEGNSGPYLQYAHARARSILRKSETAHEAPSDLQADERSLARKLNEYPEVIERATAELMPHHICTYLYELAQTFNRFYEHNRVIDDAREAIRLTLVQTYADTLKAGLELLGIHAPEKM